MTVTVTSNLQEPAEREPSAGSDSGFGADGRAAYARTRRRASAQALLLALPLLLFLLATFIAPIA
ncbi:MAG: putative spermidine/putrescine transport system permease protein, partial [Caballeronia sp.]|nr:putative spermidine/putrescine transport system permease protein [Caballeronia sp.]